MQRGFTNQFVLAAAVLATARAALAGPAFTIPDAEVSSSGQIVTINIGAVGPGEVQGMNFYLTVAAPLEIIGLKIDGPGTLFGSNSMGAYVDVYPMHNLPNAQIALGSVSTASGWIVPNGLPAAIATIRVPWGTPLGRYELSTDLTSEYGVAADWAGIPASAQGYGSIIVPEPACGLLLLGGAVLIRRKFA